MTELKHQDWIQRGLEELDGCQEELVDLISRITQVPAPAMMAERGGLLRGL